MKMPSHRDEITRIENVQINVSKNKVSSVTSRRNKLNAHKNKLEDEIESIKNLIEEELEIQNKELEEIDAINEQVKKI